MSGRRAATVLDGPTELLNAVGRHLGSSDPLTVDAERVLRYTRATGDPRGLGVDPEAPGSPADTVPEHLVLALSNLFLPQILEVRGFETGVNVGTDRVRFPAPLPVGGQVRAGARLVAATEVPTGVDTLVEIEIVLHDSGRTVCLVESRSRWLT